MYTAPRVVFLHLFLPASKVSEYFGARLAGSRAAAELSFPSNGKIPILSQNGGFPVLDFLVGGSTRGIKKIADEKRPRARSLYRDSLIWKCN